MKDLLVTGAAGVIASNPVVDLNRRGHENIAAVDALPALRHS